MTQYTISIIIPVLNEAKIIQTTLARLTHPQAEIIVVDGGSQDDTVAIATQAATVITVVGKGRGGQMNAGAKIAQSEILLFLHADTQLPANFIELITQTLKQPKTIAGAFELKIDGRDKSLRWIRTASKNALVSLLSSLWRSGNFYYQTSIY